MQDETRFKQRVLADLKATFPRAYTLKTQERARRGVPDILNCIEGKFVAIELKRDGEKPDALQTVILDKIQAAGGIAFWTNPTNWEFHLTQLKGLIHE